MIANDFSVDILIKGLFIQRVVSRLSLDGKRRVAHYSRD